MLLNFRQQLPCNFLLQGHDDEGTYLKGML